MATTKTPKAPAPTASYLVISPLRHDGVDFAIGEAVDLTAAEAAPLLGHTVTE